MRLTKKWFIVLLILWPVLFGIGIWDGEYVMSAVTGFGVTMATYYEQKLDRIDKQNAAMIRDSANSKLMTFVFVALMLAFIIGVFFFDQPTVPLLETIYLVLGVLLTLRGLFMRSAYQDALTDTSNVIRL
jgi:undecaprenyl pyrophosphate phosphatase UppP